MMAIVIMLYSRYKRLYYVAYSLTVTDISETCYHAMKLIKYQTSIDATEYYFLTVLFMYGIRYLTTSSLRHLCHLSKGVSHSLTCTFDAEIVFVFLCLDCVLSCIIFVFYLIFVFFSFSLFAYGIYLPIFVYL